MPPTDDVLHDGRLSEKDVQLRTPKSAPPNIEKLRDALEQRAAEWRATLRDEPIVARRLLRRLVGPLTLWDAAEPEVEWETDLKPALLEGLAPIQVGTSPSIPSWNQILVFLQQMAQLREVSGSAA